MAELISILLATALCAGLWWAFRSLPNEEWQIIASVPSARTGAGAWRGVNYTYYGLIIACACVVAVATGLILLGAAGISLQAALALNLSLLALSLPAARLVARIVEKKRHTFTVAGASFVGMSVAPVAAVIVEHYYPSTHGGKVSLVMPMLAALSVAYAMGEGLGRTACISFGCCYGKPVRDCSRLVRQLLAGYSFVFSGKTKKIAYEAGLDGEPVVPIQAITSTIYVGTALAGIVLYLGGRYCAAFLVCILVTQSWRTVSETVRADFRGGSRVSAYQIMAVLASLYAVAVAYWWSGLPAPAADLMTGLSGIWDPSAILALQGLGVAVFLYTGRSTVTAAEIRLFVVQERT